jgi:phosphatidylserine/phosphatidylglycerophosphate/cardiolipin synthase-like enzyme
LANFVTKTFQYTQNDQVAFSPEFTTCNDCGRTVRGLKDKCSSCGSENIEGMTRITGYYSKVAGWNKGKIGETATEIKEKILPKTPSENTTEPEIYFCPRDDCERHLSELLDSANVSIHCATFELNLPGIVRLLVNKSRDGLDVRVVVDGNYYDEVEQYSWARHDGGQGLMHNKFCVVDGRYVYGGSMNPTYNCANRNNNNLLLIDSRYLAANYEAEFEELMNYIEEARFERLGAFAFSRQEKTIAARLSGSSPISVDGSPSRASQAGPAAGSFSRQSMP